MKLEVMVDTITLLHLNDIKEKMPNNLVKVLALILMVKYMISNLRMVGSIK